MYNFTMLLMTKLFLLTYFSFIIFPQFHMFFFVIAEQSFHNEKILQMYGLGWLNFY